MEDKRDILYSNLIKSGKVSTNEIGTVEQFKTAIKDESTAKQFHKNLLGAGFSQDEIGSEMEFYNSISSDFLNITVSQDLQSQQSVNSHSLQETPDYASLIKAGQERMQEYSGEVLPTDAVSNSIPSTSAYQPKIENARPVDVGRGIEEKMIDSQVERIGKLPNTSDKNILENYNNRYAMTDEGRVLRDSIEKKRMEVSDRLAKDYLASDLYKELSSRYTGKELDAKANEEFNRVYGGRIEEELAPAYNEYRDKMLHRYGDNIQSELTGLAKENTENQVASLKEEVKQGLEAAYGEWSGKQSEYENNHPVLSALSGVRSGSNTRLATPTDDKKFSNWYSAMNLLDESEKMIAEAKKKGAPGALLRGVRDGVFDVDTWTSGITDMIHGSSLKIAAEKSERGDTLTPEEEKLLEAAAVNMATNAYFASDLSRSYRAGQTAGVSIPFTLGFLLNPVSGSGNAIAKGILKYGVKRFGLHVLKSSVVRNGLKMGSRLIGDAVAATAMTATTGIGKVAAGANERMIGDVKFDFTEDGKIKYAGRENQMGVIEAFGKSTASNTIENFSEMFFNAFNGGGKIFGNYLKKAIPGIERMSSSELEMLYNGMKNNAFFRDFAKRTQFHGLLEEHLEEVVGSMMNIPLGESSWEETFDLDNNLDILCGLAPMSVFMGAVGAGGFVVENRRIRKNLNRLSEEMTPEQKAMLDNVVEQSKDMGNQDVRNSMKAALLNKRLTDAQKRTHIEYLYNKLQEKAAKAAREKETEDAIQKETDDIVNSSNQADGTVTECSRITTNEIGETVLVPGHIVGWMGGTIIENPDGTKSREGGQPIWQAVGSKERITLHEGEYEPESIKSMPTKDMIDATAEMMREEAQKEAEMESKYDMKRIDPPSGGTTFTDINGRQITIVDKNPNDPGNGWIAKALKLDEKGNPKKDEAGNVLEENLSITNADYYDAMQAQLDAQEKKNALQQKYGTKVLDDGRIAVITSERNREISYDIIGFRGNLEDSGNMSLEEYESLQDYVPVQEEELSDDGLPVNSRQEENSSNLSGNQVENETLSPAKENIVTSNEALDIIAEVNPATEPMQEQKPALPVDEKGNILYHKMPVENTIADLTDGTLDDNEIDGFIAANKAEAGKLLKKVSESAPKISTNKAKYLADKKAWQEKVADAQARVDYWNSVGEEIAASRVQPGDKTAEAILSMGEPLNGEELAAMMLGTGRLPILYDSYKKETGGRNAEARGMVGLFATKANGGLSIEEAGEQLMLADQENGTHFFDENDPNAGRNAIIDVLSGARTRGDLFGFIQRNREALAERERQAELEAYEQTMVRLAEASHMTPEEFIAFEENIVQMLEERLKDIPDEELKSIFAELYLDENYGRSRESDEVGTGVPKGEGRAESNEGSPGVLSEERGDNAGASEYSEERPELDDEIGQSGDGILPEADAVDGREEIKFTPPTQIKGENLLDYAARVVESKRVHDAGSEVDTTPTEAQKEAGNYKKGHVKIDGFDITIENPKGSVRSGVDADGKPWSVTMNNTYGYIRGTEGVDGDHIDVFLGDSGNKVYVVDQLNTETGAFDEHKVMYGFNSVDEATEAYLFNYSPGWQGFGAISEVSKESFKKWIDSSHRKTKPFVDYKSVKVENGGETVVNLPESNPVASSKKSELGIEIPAMTEEEYIASEGYGFSGIGDVALHKGKQRTSKQQDKIVESQAKKDEDYAKHREILRKKYRDKLSKGELREPNIIEKLLKTANGNPDNESTQAARRTLQKRGIDWQETSIRFRETASSEEQAIIEKAKEDGTYLKAPNGKPTNLNEKQWAQVRTESFKKWFGDWENEPDTASKVIDENGEPKVVKHGTPNTFFTFSKENIGNNDPGWLGTGFYFFGNNEIYANQYAGNNGLVMDTFLNIRNPYYASYSEMEKLAEINSKESSKDFSDKLKDEGFDGVSYNGDLNDEWVAYEPIQIKSATVNVGQFSTENDDIRFRVVHHGSGASFDKFSTEFIDTGEGNQSFGWGLYFTDKKDIAQYYAETIGGMPSYVLYKDGQRANMDEQISRIIYNFDGSVKKAIASNKKTLKYLEKEGDEEFASESRKIISELEKEDPKAWKLKEEGNRYLYDVEIPDTGFLHWDKAVADEQKRQIIQQANKEGLSFSFYGDIVTPEEYFQKNQPEGFQVYKMLSKILDGDKEASMFLNRSGFNGIEYAAGRHSGNTKLPDSNFVVFDENAVRIINHLRYRLDGRRIEEVNERFNEELSRYKDGRMKSNEMFHLGTPQGAMLAFLPDLPIVMRQKTIRKGTEKKHNVDVDMLKDMPAMIASPIFVFQRDVKKMGILTEMIDRDGKNVCVAIEMNKTIQDGTNILEVNDIRSFHGREVENIIKPIRDNGTLKWVDKEKGLDWITSALHNFKQAQSDQNLSTEDFSSATKIVESFENPTTEQGKIVSEVESLADNLHTPVRIVKSTAELPEGDVARKRIENGDGIKGWFDTKSEEMAIYLPNATSVEDARGSVFHEVVGHYGLRKLFGADFNTFLDNVYVNVSPEIRKQIVVRAKERGNILDLREATEEYLAALAERGFDSVEERTLWQKIKDAFIDMLRKAGVHLGFDLTDNELRYVLWRSYQNLESQSIMDRAADIDMQRRLRVGNFRENEAELHFSELKKEAERLKELTGRDVNLGRNKEEVAFMMSNDGADAGTIDHVRDTFARAREEGKKFFGFFDADTGKVYLCADQIKDINQLRGKWIHEISHQITSQFSDQELAKLYDKVGVDEIEDFIGDFYRDLPKERKVDEYLSIAVEEIVTDTESFDELMKGKGVDEVLEHWEYPKIMTPYISTYLKNTFYGKEKNEKILGNDRRGEKREDELRLSGDVRTSSKESTQGETERRFRTGKTGTGEEENTVRAYKKEIRELNNRISSLERAIERYENGENVSKAVIDEIRRQISSDFVNEINKSELNSLLAQVQKAKTKKSLEKIFMNVKRVALDAHSRKLQRVIDKLLVLKVQDVNGKNMSIAKNVDDSTRKIFTFIRGNLSDLKISGLEDEILFLKRENRKRQEEVKRLEHIARDSSDVQERESSMTSIEELKKAIEESKKSIKELRDEANEIKESVANFKDVDIEKELGLLNDKIERAARNEDTWTQNDNERMAALNIISATITNKKHDYEIRDIELRIQKMVLNNSDLYRERGGLKDEVKRKRINEKIKENHRQIGAMERLINDTRSMQVQQMQMTIDQLNELISNGKNSLLRKTEDEMKRKRMLIGNAIRSVEGKPVNIKTKDLDKERTLKKFFSAPMGSFEYMCQRVNTKTLGKDGFLYKRFIEGSEGTMRAYDTYILGMKEVKSRLNEKTRELFGKSFEKITSLSDKVVNESGVHVFDPTSGDGYGVRYEEPMSKGQAMYIYQVWKMADGRTKLELQGFDEESIAEIVDFIGPEYVKFADWVQEEFLPELRERYNERYLEMYNTSLAKIENYIPLKINKNAIREESSLSDDGKKRKTLEEKAGSLINRVVNTHPVDMVNGFNVLLEHTNQMEEWNAYARVRRDLDYILSSTIFRNQLNANVRGSYKNFYDAAEVATMVHHPESSGHMDEVLGKISKGIVGGNISFRLYTAIKQTLSAPAFLGYSQSPFFMAYLAKNASTPYQGFKWCMENIPSFYERVTSGTTGNEKLNEKSFKKWMDKYIEYGMIPNKLVDALTCSFGAKSIYDYKYSQLKKSGLSEKESHNQALAEADIYYNATQQSSHPAFLSPMQMSRTFTDRMFTTYQNSNIGYVRKVMASYYDLTRSLKWKELKKNYTEMYMQEGLSVEEAESKAYRRLLNENKKHVVELALFGWGLNMLWNIGSQGLLGFLRGDGDDDDKWTKGLAFMLTSPMKGLPGGNLLESIASGYGMNPFLVFEELEKFMKEAKYAIDEYGLISSEIAYITLSKASRYTGVDLEVWGNVYLGVEGMARDGALADDRMIDVMYLLNAPKSNRATVAKELYRDEPLLDFAEKVARANKYIPKRDGWEGWVPGVKDLTKRRKNEIAKEYERLHMTEEQKKEADERKIAGKHKRKLKELEDDILSLAEYIDGHKEEHQIYQKYN